MKGELKLKLNAEEETLQENEIHFVPKSTNHGSIAEEKR